MDDLDRRIINELQQGLPLCDRPFASLSRELDVDERQIVARIERLLEDNVLTRFGPLFDAERLGGALALCALSAPTDRLEETARLVNAHPEVAHNYEREHRLNMWFVLATEQPAQIAEVVSMIEAETGCRVFQFPKQEEFYVGLKLEA